MSFLKSNTLLNESFCLFKISNLTIFGGKKHKMQEKLYNCVCLLLKINNSASQILQHHLHLFWVQLNPGQRWWYTSHSRKPSTGVLHFNFCFFPRWDNTIHITTEAKYAAWQVHRNWQFSGEISMKKYTRELILRGMYEFIIRSIPAKESLVS